MTPSKRAKRGGPEVALSCEGCMYLVRRGLTPGCEKDMTQAMRMAEHFAGRILGTG